MRRLFSPLVSNLIKPLRVGAVIVNTARGSIIDEEAMIDLLEEGAPLDVFEPEPAVDPRWVRDCGAPHMPQSHRRSGLLCERSLRIAVAATPPSPME